MVFNRISKSFLLCCIIIFAISVISACTDSNKQVQYASDGIVEFSAGNNESVLIEYIIVLNENVGIDNALNNLQQYEAQVIRDLKKSRYLIGLKNDPGIERLKKEVEASEQIKLIQPNYSYTTQ